MQITVEELSCDVEKLLNAIQYGDPIFLMYHGKPQAKIVKLTSKTSPKRDLSESPLFGLWQDREDCQDVEAYVDDLRRGRFSC
ncbi:MAG: hypothetical protein VSS75_023440 [Candidatus Parabeggiatoa sp.]|nr:hypothetical protein [Candidatus Parabeggiatoa sp.]